LCYTVAFFLALSYLKLSAYIITKRRDAGITALLVSAAMEHAGTDTMADSNSLWEPGNQLEEWDFPPMHPRVSRFIEHGEYGYAMAVPGKNGRTLPGNAG
jgi:hypothetical protein